MSQQANILARPISPPSSRRFLITQKGRSLDQHVPAAFPFHGQPHNFEHRPKRVFSDRFHMQMAAGT
jgi:hypothetical protein